MQSWKLSSIQKYNIRYSKTLNINLNAESIFLFITCFSLEVKTKEVSLITNLAEMPKPPEVYNLFAESVCFSILIN